METNKDCYYLTTHYKYSTELDGDEYPNNHPFLTISKESFEPRYNCFISVDSLTVDGDLTKVITVEEVEKIGIYEVKQKYGIK